jgi:hypothetical protein
MKSFVIFILGMSSPVLGAKIPVKVKSVFHFDSEAPASIHLLCLTRDNTEIHLETVSPSEHIIYTAKPLSTCELQKEIGDSVKIKMLEGRLTDELKTLRVAAPSQTAKSSTTVHQIKMKASKSKSKKSQKKLSISAKR